LSPGKKNFASLEAAGLMIMNEVIQN
jgi:hypothetical protein